MANASILAAFERMWQYISTALSGKADKQHSHDDLDVKNLTINGTTIQEMIKDYVDETILGGEW